MMNLDILPIQKTVVKMQDFDVKSSSFEPVGNTKIENTKDETSSNETEESFAKLISNLVRAKSKGTVQDNTKTSSNVDAFYTTTTTVPTTKTIDETPEIQALKELVSDMLAELSDLPPEDKDALMQDFVAHLQQINPDLKIEDISLPTTTTKDTEALSKIANLSEEIGNILESLKAQAPQTTPAFLTTPADTNSNTQIDADQILPSQEIFSLLQKIVTLSAQSPQSDDITKQIESLKSLLAQMQPAQGETIIISNQNYSQEDIAALQDILKRLEANPQVPLSDIDAQKISRALDGMVTLTAPVQNDLTKTQGQTAQIQMSQGLPQENLRAAQMQTAANLNAPERNNTHEKNTSNDDAAQSDVTFKTQTQTPTQPTEKHYAQSRYDARYSRNPHETSNAPEQTQDAKDFLKSIDAKTFAANLANQNATDAHAGKVTTQSMGTNTTLLVNTSISSSADSLSLSVANIPMQPQTLNAQLTNVTTQNQHAAYPHPATQTVMASIQKAAQAGEDTTIKLQLDPPELGRVEVKMSIDKDNTTKLVLSAEKPETLNLLQKDAQILERALQDAGLQTQSGGMSFELAQGNNAFSEQNNKNPRAHQQTGKELASSNLDVIETTMNWHVDPATGKMHYNILV